MVNSLCSPIHYPFNLSPVLHFCLSSSLIPLPSLTPRFLHRHLGFACHFLLDSDLWNSEESEIDHNFSGSPSETAFIPIISRVSYPALKINTGNPFDKKHSFRKWGHKDNSMKRITSALSNQGWDLNFHSSLVIDLDSWYFTRMLNDLYDESLDAALVYYLFRILHRSVYKLKQKLHTYCLMVHIAVSVLVDGHCKNDDIQGAENVFNALERDGFKADVTTYNTLINVYSKKGHMHKAYELVDLMRKAGIFPDSVTYNMIMHGLIKRGFAIKTIFNELIRRGYSPDKMYSSDKFTCTNIIHGYSKEGRLGEAYLIWCSMSKRGMAPDVVTCSALLNGFCKMHRMQDADVLFQKMLDAGLVPDLILYNTLVRGFCSVGDISKACQILVMMRASGIFPNDTTHCALIIGFEKNGIENAQESVTMLMQQMFSME
ncbi:pentatricopeptide repeat-containing protein At2g19280-like isoform X1 [Phalaenopsis equestris]|uniref:pentatricopeptide repeat-containing protein At2g19280-like isoform X1 n=1 Tax=Phalaenopsis equestris TaxID=78828 RepID=UPI0009E303D8|nr:pentatricopeptide repeat-containing protein At2g19280-like isoform X1 [Phalaenopsis equestris]XP_020596609.1 pentatricopeptide repeat-containing protein At2g19280-like isoform X1 [Phalaenopsis equestris]XP_020596610.1 pentatricopeptide repeat-containing protein At2g19280-like isoform X1 [Phalaenopsis equestris]